MLGLAFHPVVFLSIQSAYAKPPISILSLPWSVLAHVHHCPELAAQFLQHHQFLCLFLVYIPSITYAEGSWKETASAWIRSPELVPIPGHRARRSACGLGTSGSTSVVLASRIHDCVGPRENAGPKPMLLWPLTSPRTVKTARLLKPCMLAWDSFAVEDLLLEVVKTCERLVLRRL